MKALTNCELSAIRGAGVCEVGGTALAIGILAVGAGIATGGIAFFVVGGLGAYVGAGAGALCGMY